MDFYSLIIDYLLLLTDYGKKTGDYLKINQKSVVFNDTLPLFQITRKDLLLIGKENIFREILSVKTTESSFLAPEKIKQFSSKLKIIRLNHLGISYCCQDFDKEINNLKNLITNTPFKLYEENSSQKNQRWFFLGDVAYWENPLFEIVLTLGEARINKWIPHFQIDLDTENSSAELKLLSSKYLKSRFFDWELAIPKIGIVLMMGCLADIYGTKIYLGLGTNKRLVKFHRQKILQQIA